MNCRVCRTHITAYLHGELPPRSRRRVARHLADCAPCQARYTRERELARELTNDLQLLGRHQPALSHIWSSIQDDLARTNARRPRYPGRYGLAALALVAALMLPWLFGGPGAVALTPATQPAPVTATLTAPGTEAPAAMALTTAALTITERSATGAPDAVPVPESTAAP